MIQSFEIIALILLLLFFSVFSLLRKLLDFKGIIAANIIGILVFFAPIGGMRHFFVVLVFFLLAEFFTKWGRQDFEKHEPRSTGNILGNSLVAVAGLWLGLEIIFFGAISAALADTLSSEIGLRSKKKPILIVPPFNEVEAGTNGGITFLGIIASIFGGIVIGTVYAIIHFNVFNESIFVVSMIIAFAGLFGSIADSFFGAVLESRKLVSNDSVNFLATLAGGLFAFAFLVLYIVFVFSDVAMNVF